MLKALHPGDNVDRLNVSRKKRRKKTCQHDESLDTSIQWIEDYIKKGGKILIKAISNNTDNTSINRTTITRKQKWQENNFMDISRDKQVKSNEIKLRRG